MKAGSNLLTTSTTKPNSRVLTMVRIGVLSGLAFILIALEVPLPMFPVWLKYDPSELPALVAAFALGPVAGPAVELFKNVLFFFLLPGKAPLVGVVANFVAGSAWTLSAGLVYARWRTFRGAVVALALGVLIMTAVMAVANYAVFLPLYGVPPAGRLGMVLSVLTPFNLVKGTLSGLLTLLLYKKIRSRFLS